MSELTSRAEALETYRRASMGVMSTAKGVPLRGVFGWFELAKTKIAALAAVSLAEADLAEFMSAAQGVRDMELNEKDRRDADALLDWFTKVMTPMLDAECERLGVGNKGVLAVAAARLGGTVAFTSGIPLPAFKLIVADWYARCEGHDGVPGSERLP